MVRTDNLPKSYNVNPRTYGAMDLQGCEEPDQAASGSNNDLHKDIEQEDPPSMTMSENIAKIENIFNTVGFGRWNTWFILLICLGQSSSPTQYYASVFTNMPLDFRCEDNFTVKQHHNYINNYCGELEFVSIYNNSMRNSNNQNNMSFNSSYGVCLKYVYDKSLFDSTFSNEFDLVCDRAWISQLFQLLLGLGSIFGNMFTRLSDKYGRARVIKVSSCFYVLGVLVVGFGYNMYIVLLGRFFIGFWYPIFTCAAYTLAMETTPTQYRSTVGVMVFVPYHLLTVLLGLFAYNIREWRLLHLLISFPIYFIPLVAMMISESPRWLIQQGYLEEAYSVLKCASIQNGTILTSAKNIIQLMNMNDPKCSYENSQEGNDNKFASKNMKNSLLASSKMKQISIITPFIWLLTSLVYVAVPLNANNFTTNPFMYIILLGSVQIPVDACGHFIIGKFGNIKTFQVSFMIIGVCMFISASIPKEIIWPKYVLIGIATILLSIVFAICFILSNELFPTVNRSFGGGICMTAYYIGFLFGSLITNYDITWGYNVVCGLCSIAAGFLIMFLPETQGKPLCETVDEVDNRT